jgi:glutathione S-transferase
LVSPGECCIDDRKGIEPRKGKDVFRKRLVARYSHLNEHLKNNEYLMGRAYSFADAHFFVVSSWANWVNFDLSPYANVVSHCKRISARAAVRATLEAEGLIPWPSSPP